MRFYWDPPKAAQVWRKRFISLANVEAAFRDPNRLEYLDDRVDYGEKRWVLVGIAGPRLITVVFTEREDTAHIITAWPSTRLERRGYDGVL